VRFFSPGGDALLRSSICPASRRMCWGRPAGIHAQAEQPAKEQAEVYELNADTIQDDVFLSPRLVPPEAGRNQRRRTCEIEAQPAIRSRPSLPPTRGPK
jgi:hypothetical protein